MIGTQKAKVKVVDIRYGDGELIPFTPYVEGDDELQATLTRVAESNDRELRQVYEQIEKEREEQEIDYDLVTRHDHEVCSAISIANQNLKEAVEEYFRGARVFEVYKDWGNEDEKIVYLVADESATDDEIIETLLRWYKEEGEEYVEEEEIREIISLIRGQTEEA